MLHHLLHADTQIAPVCAYIPGGKFGIPFVIYGPFLGHFSAMQNNIVFVVYRPCWVPWVATKLIYKYDSYVYSLLSRRKQTKNECHEQDSNPLKLWW